MTPQLHAHCPLSIPLPFFLTYSGSSARLHDTLSMPLLLAQPCQDAVTRQPRGQLFLSRAVTPSTPSVGTPVELLLSMLAKNLAGQLPPVEDLLLVRTALMQGADLWVLGRMGLHAWERCMAWMHGDAWDNARASRVAMVCTHVSCQPTTFLAAGIPHWTFVQRWLHRVWTGRWCPRCHTCWGLVNCVGVI